MLCSLTGFYITSRDNGSMNIENARHIAEDILNYQFASSDLSFGQRLKNEFPRAAREMEVEYVEEYSVHWRFGNSPDFPKADRADDAEQITLLNSGEVIYNALKRLINQDDTAPTITSVTQDGLRNGVKLLRLLVEESKTTGGSFDDPVAGEMPARAEKNAKAAAEDDYNRHADYIELEKKMTQLFKELDIQLPPENNRKR